MQTDETVKPVAHPDCSMCQMQPPSHKVAFDLTKRGIKADLDRKYEEAAKLYEECEVYLNHTIEHELETNMMKYLFRFKLQRCLDRAKRLRLHLEERRKIKEEKLRIKKMKKLQPGHCG